jgi:hypothetical protein
MIKDSQTKELIENPKGYKVLVYISMFYMSIMLCNAILTNRYIGNDTLFVLGGTFTSPLVFILDDIIAEIYGYKITRSVILTGYLAQMLFVVVCQLALIAPHPSFFNQQSAYNSVLGSSLLWISFSGYVAYVLANLANSRILSRWKILIKGRHFWLRSIGSSMFSEAFYSLIAIAMMEITSISITNILQVAAISFSIKAIYSILLAGPANILVNYLKKITGIDVYDFPKKFTPFKYSQNTEESVI